jgi:hypothetical protein
MAKKKCTIFLKRSDLYALPVSLTYNSINNYPTQLGGVFSIVSFVIIACWLALNISGVASWEFNY